jgi:hypothetical protein
MSEIVEYVSNPEPIVFADGQAVFGAYKVTFDDGCVVMLPHTGWPGTISEDPLDVEDDEHRAVLVASAEPPHFQALVKRDIDDLPSAQEDR